MSRRVTHLMSFYDVPGKVAFSGAENHLFTLMQGQQQAGWEVELVMVVGLDGPRLHEKAEELRRQGITVTLVTYPVTGLGTVYKLLRPLIVARLAGWLRQRRDRVVHVHLLTGSSGLIVLAAWLAGCRTIVASYHNNEPWMTRQPHRLGMQLIDRVVRQTIAISAAVREHLIAGTGLDAGRLNVVYYGIDNPARLPDRRGLRARFGVAENAFLVGLVGRLTPQKDIPLFLQALQQLPDVTGIIIGGGDLEGELRAQAQQLGLTNCIFAGPQPDGPDLIGMLDIMVLPSVYEGLGLVLLEAMVRKVPIIGSTGGAIPEITEQGRLARLFPVRDLPAFVSAIRDLQQQAQPRAQLAQTAYDRAVEKYTVPAMVANTAAVYERAAAG